MKIPSMLLYLYIHSVFFVFYCRLIRNVNIDLPSYKELFPSHPHINNSDNDSSLPPPSYDDYVKTLQPITSLPISSLHSHALPSSPSRCIWITDRTRRPLCIRGPVTYV